MTKEIKTHQNQHHHPVLLESVVELLAPRPGQSYLDLTAGYGGHTAAVLKQAGDSAQATLVDRDPQAIAVLKERFADNKNVQLINTDFANAANDLVAGGQQYDMVLADLGVSSPHLDNAHRGFSFSRAGPLDMRMDQRQSTTAADILNDSSTQDLADIFYRYGELKSSRRLAQVFIAERPFSTTEQLVEAVSEIFKWQAKRVLPQVFQALRIAVNDELHQVEMLLPLLPKLLKPGGRVVIISFHSLEDRLVKQYFAKSTFGLDAKLRLLTKKPIKGSQHDINPRARSAILRAAVKQK